MKGLLNALLDTIASYVPSLVTQRYAARMVPIEAAESDSFPAAVLLADISGFTRLTERLAQGGPAGAELLVRILNEYFGHLIDLVGEHGGDIAKFAGDALLVLWPRTEAGEGLAGLARRAAQCGLAMQQPFELSMADDETRLSLRVSIGAGELAMVHVGGVYGRWEFVVTGEALASLATVSHAIHPGHVAVTAVVAALLDGMGILRQLPEGGAVLEGLKEMLPARRLATPELADRYEAGLRGYLPAVVRSKLDAGQGGWLAELRRLSVLFVNLPDLTHETPLEKAQEVVRRLQASIYRYEGSLNKISVDEKGISMLAAMGLPPLSHEDDALRAIQAGVAIRDTLTGLGVRFAVGIATGLAFCGEIGNSRRREYTIMGDVVNRAARLMQGAMRHNDVLCDGTTRQGAQARFNLESLGKVTVKGRTEEVELFRPVAELKKQDRAAKLVGRMAERADVEMMLLDLQGGGQGGVVVVEGDAGMGKSALVMFYMLQARVLGFETLLGSADAVERNTPYYAWRPVFAQIFKIDPAAHDLDARRRAVLATLGEDPDLLGWAPLLNPLLPLDFAETDQSAPLSGQVRAARTNELLVKLLARSVEKGPTMLVIEDGHWLDSASWALLRQVCQSVRPLIIVVASRPIPDPVPPEYRQILDVPGARRQRLGPLQPDEIELMLLRRLDVKAIPRELAAFIVARAGGHPFFSEEVALALRDGGFVTIAGGECHLAPRIGDLQALDLPDTVQGLITSRIDRVTPAQQLTLKVASVIGRSFPVRILKAIFPIEDDRPRLGDFLEAMERLDLTPLETPPPETIYMFNHMITHEVVYNLMLFAQRRELHQKVAEWFETTYATDLAPYYPLLAHHWSKADHPAHATRYFDLAGEQALQAGAYVEAARFYDAALEADAAARTQARQAGATDADRWRRARWERLMGQAYLGAGRTIEAREHLKRALALMSSPLPDTRLGLHAEVLVAGWREALARLRGDPGPPAVRPPEAEHVFEIARSYAGLGEIYLQNNEPLELEYSCLRVLNLTRPFGSSSELADALGFMGLLAGAARKHGQARAYLQWARACEERSGDLPTRVGRLLRTGAYHLGNGDWPAVVGVMEQAVALCDQLGDARQRAEAVVTQAHAYLYSGDDKRALELLRALAVEAAEHGYIQPQCRALSGLVSCLLRSGRTQDAIAILEQNLLLQESNPERMALLVWHGQMARAYARALRLDLAWKEVCTVESLLVATPVTYAPDAYFGMPEVYLALLGGAPDALPASRADLVRRLGRAVRLARRIARRFAVAEPQTWLVSGQQDWLLGRKARARRAWQRSLDAARRLGMPYEETLASAELARVD